MLLILGFGRKKKKDRGEIVQVKCPRCANTVFYHYTHTRTWFTLYFIPILPYRSERRLECPICSHGMKISSGEVEEVRQGRIDILSQLEHVLGSSTRIIS